MYLSCIELDATTLDVVRLLGSPYRTHAAVERAFSENAVRETEKGRILWRVDTLLDSPIARLYIASPDQPDLGEWSLRCNLHAESIVSVQSKDYEPFLARIDGGTRWNFRLKANPVRRVLVDKGRRENQSVVGTLQGHVTVAQQMEWLLERADSHGFQIESQDGTPCVLVSNRHRETFKRQGKTVTLTTAQYDGVLTVTDVDAFRLTLCRGVGRAKGFGCGLLTIVPA